MGRERTSHEAARWVLRLAESPSDGDRRAFEAWRAQSIDHEIAYERELAAWEALDRLKALRTPRIVPDPELLSDEPAPSSSQRPRVRRWAALAASLALMISAGATVMVSMSAAPAYATGVGERRLVRLADGTSVELNTDSKIVVRYVRSRRVVELVRGEAMFHVAKGDRPFSIQAEKATLATEGGDLSVRLVEAGAQVTVREGVVLADAVNTPGAPDATLGANAKAIVGSDGAVVETMTGAEMAQALAWRQGAIILDGQTLAEAVAEFNRYNERKIVVADRTAGAIRVGGYFDTSDVDGFVSAIARTFPIRVTEREGGRILLSKKA